MGQITVKQLSAILAEAIRDGYGDRKIVISDDTEGNGYHGLFYGISTASEAGVTVGMIYDSQETNPDNIIILG